MREAKEYCRRLFAMVLVLELALGYLPSTTIQTQAATKKVTVKSVTLDKKQYVLKKGKKVTLKATILPKGAKSQKVSFQSSNKKIVTVTSKGVVKAVGKRGTAIITAKVGNKKAKCKIVIGTPVTKISASNMNLTVGQAKKIAVTLNPKKPTVKTLSYKSSNTRVATVDKSGKVTAKSAGSAKITILATDCNKVKKVITVKVSKKAVVTKAPTVTKTPTITLEPTVTKTPTATPTPVGVLKVEKAQVDLKIGENFTPQIVFEPETLKEDGVVVSSSDATVAAVVDANGGIHALTPGECDIQISSKKNGMIKTSYHVTVSSDGVTTKTVGNETELLAALQEQSEGVITLQTNQENVQIPAGVYEKVTLVVDAPNAHIENEATFKEVLIKAISDNTWVERCGNHLYMDGKDGHILVGDNAQPNLYLLEDSEAVTITNNGDLQELLIASAAKVLVKGDSIANRLTCHVYREDTTVATYIPLDIYSTTTYQLVVGPGGEQTAIRCKDETSVPKVSGLGTLSITVDSTGQTSSVIAENDGTLKELPKTSIAGKVLNEDNTGATGTVYLVSYSKEVIKDNVSVHLNGASTKKTNLVSGEYLFENVCIGNYIVIVESDGYELITQNIFVSSSYADKTFLVDDITLMETAGEPGAIEGELTDASTGEVITSGVEVLLRRGMNNITADPVQRTVVAADGRYSFTQVTPGQYTVQVKDATVQSVYVSAYYNVNVLAGAVQTKNITVSKRLSTSEVRFVLTWDKKGEGVSQDLDIYLYGPNPYNAGECEVHFGEYSNSYYCQSLKGKEASYSNLDVDDKEYEGPETITVKKPIDGIYKIFVSDYTNGGNGTGLAASHPEIKVYVGNNLMDTVKMPQKAGGVWYALNYDGTTGKVSVVDDVYDGQCNTTTRAKIATYFNLLEQFTVVDEKAFAVYQQTLDLIRTDYEKQQNEEKLKEYLTQIEEVYQKFTDCLTVTSISGEGLSEYTFDEYKTYHNYYGFWGTTEELPELKVVFSEKGAASKYKVEKVSDSNYYHLIYSNSEIGISTYYDFYYQKQEDDSYWVTNITDSTNSGFETELYRNYGYVGGYNEKIGKNLKFTYKEGIELVSAEYKDDVEEASWTYGEYVDAVLHLKDTKTNATLDFSIYYIPLGVEIKGIEDSNNVIYSVSNNYYWTNDENYNVLRVTGKNKELGDTYIPILEEGATYELKKPQTSTEDWDNNMTDCDGIIEVTAKNGAKHTYCVYYYQDSSAAALVGIRDKDNMYTSYSENIVYRSKGRVYYNLYISGLNSTLGENVIAYTKDGAAAKIEYTQDNDSFDVTSDARIVVSAQDGVERTYYVIYKKTDEDVNLRSVDSKENELKKVVCEGSEIDIIGTEKKLGAKLDLKCNPGYTATYNEDTQRIEVTKEATGQVERYNVNYKRDTSSVSLRSITSKENNLTGVSIATYLSTMSREDETFEYFRVRLKGDAVKCTKDLQAEVSYGCKAEITYAEDATKDAPWIYGDNYVALIVVSNDKISINYLVSYEQDDSKAVIEKITDVENTYVCNPYISTYGDTEYYYADGKQAESEKVYKIFVTGSKESFGDTYKLQLPTGTTVKSDTQLSVDGPRYEDMKEYYSYYLEEQDRSYSAYYDCVRRIVVQAANKSERIYAIYYVQDQSGACIEDVTDSENTYIKKQLTEDSTISVMNRFTSQWENLNPIYLVGNNAQLGNTYELKTKGNAKVKMIKSDSEEYPYESGEVSHGWYEQDRYVYRTLKYSDYLEVTASNGAVRKYLICYCQDDSQAVITKISDTNNKYDERYTRINGNTTTMNLVDEEGRYTDKYEKVYIIDVVGKNATIGDNYELEKPEGTTVKITKNTDKEWKYSKGESERTFYGENGESKTFYGRYEDRIEVTAANGAKRIYVIFYSPDTSDLELEGITDETNILSNVEIATTKSILTTTECEEKDGCEINKSEEVYLVKIVGENGSLGQNYKLQLPEGTTYTVSHRGDKDFKYAQTYSYGYTYDEESGLSVRRYYFYTDRIVVTSKTGVSRIYLLAYSPKDQDSVVYMYNDYRSSYTQTPVVETEPISIKTAAGEEKAYLIYALGGSKELPQTYELKTCGVAQQEKSSLGDEAWNYTDKGVEREVTLLDETTQKVFFTYTDKVTITSDSGVIRTYVIAYAQDDSTAHLNGFEEDGNVFTVSPEIPTAPTAMETTATDEQGNPVTDEVYKIYVVGENETMQNGYACFKWDLPKGTTYNKWYRASYGFWPYKEKSETHSYVKNGNIIEAEFTYVAAFDVQASNGVTKRYLFAYTQDKDFVEVEEEW